MDLDTFPNRFELIRYFPKLQNDPRFKVMSQETGTYNCIAWAMGFNDRWVSHFAKLPGNDNPGNHSYWWPEGAEASSRPEALISAFEKVGFEITADPNPDPQYDKAVLYKYKSQWTHAARLLALELLRNHNLLT